MYTGIVQAACEVTVKERRHHLVRIGVAIPVNLRERLMIGASVAADGVCLTVTGWDERQVDFDLMSETLALTTLGQLQDGQRVNIERSARQGDEIGGHLLSGHIDGTAAIIAVEAGPDLRRVRYQPPSHLMKYLLPKGFVALNGCSLTIAAVDREAGWFEVSFIPETLRVTTHSGLDVGDRVNLEVDRQTQAIVDTVENVLRDNPEWARQLLTGK